MSLLPQILPLLFISVIFWALILRPQIVKIKKAESLKSKLPVASEKVDIDSAYISYRKALARWNQFAMPTMLFTMLFVFGLALFLWKITQTSDFALRYSNQAHTAMGEWIIGLGIVLLIGAGFVLPTLRAQRVFKEAKEDFRTALKDALAVAKDQSETREVIEIEQMLNTLPKTGSNLGAEVKNLV